MTYKEVAENLVTLYTNYVAVCIENGIELEDFSEEIVIAIGSLLAQSNKDELTNMSKEYFTNLNNVAPELSEEVVEELLKW